MSTFSSPLHAHYPEEPYIANLGHWLADVADTPHCFRNAAEQSARMLSMCSPAGQEEFFMEVGDAVASRTASPPKLSDAEKSERIAKAKALAPR